MFPTGWLSEEELCLSRMQQFHQQRVEHLEKEDSLLSLDGGVLILHLIPAQCVQQRGLLPSSQLKESGSRIQPLGESASSSRFNVDGFLRYDGHRSTRSYSLFFRDGRLEAAMNDVLYTQEGISALRDRICERAVLQLVPSYLRVCDSCALKPPVWMFSALVGCTGGRMIIDRGFREPSDHSIDRSPVFLPPVELTSLEIDAEKDLREWCNYLWQASGVERSMNFDKEGKWHGR